MSTERDFALESIEPRRRNGSQISRSQSTRPLHSHPIDVDDVSAPAPLRLRPRLSLTPNTPTARSPGGAGSTISPIIPLSRASTLAPTPPKTPPPRAVCPASPGESIRPILSHSNIGPPVDPNQALPPFPTQPPSRWSTSSDSGLAVQAPQPNQGSAGRNYGRDFERRKQRKWLWLIALFVLLGIAAVLGGVLAWYFTQDDHDGGSEGGMTTTSDVYTTLTASSNASTTMISTDTSTSSSKEAEKTKVPTIDERSRLGTWLTSEDPWYLRIVVFVDADGDLASSQMVNDVMIPIPIQAQSPDGRQKFRRNEDKIRKPLPSTPLHIFSLAQLPSDVHLLYVDDDYYLCLITMTAHDDIGHARTWSGGRIDSQGEDGEWHYHQPTDDVRVAFEVVPARKLDDERVNILYQSTSSEFTLLSSTDPGSGEGWSDHKVIFPKGTLAMADGSSGLIIMSTLFDDDDESKSVEGLRIIYDKVEGKGTTDTLGVVWCRLRTDGKLEKCAMEKTLWKDKAIEERMRVFSKPLSLSRESMPAADNVSGSQYIISIIDSNGTFAELYHDDKEFAGFQKLSAGGGEFSFQSVASGSEELIYAIVDDELLWFKRNPRWWDGKEGPGWELVDVVDTDMKNYKEPTRMQGSEWGDGAGSDDSSDDEGEEEDESEGNESWEEPSDADSDDDDDDVLPWGSSDNGGDDDDDDDNDDADDGLGNHNADDEEEDEEDSDDEDDEYDSDDEDAWADDELNDPVRDEDDWEADDYRDEDWDDEESWHDIDEEVDDNGAEDGERWQRVADVDSLVGALP